ncbi:MAG: cupin domain-containing protein [Candidatus Bathyarchaeia archaeon]
MRKNKMYVVNVGEVEEKVIGSHGETTKYKLIFGRGSNYPDITKSITSVWTMAIEPGGTNQPHVHEDEEQVYLVKDGCGTIVVGNERRKVEEGDAIYLPPKITHAFYNDGKRPCIIIAIGARVT